MKNGAIIKKANTKNIVLNGVMIALTFLATRIISIPGPIAPGVINLGDTVIIITAILLGRRSGMLVGAIGSALADITFPGGFVFAPVTFIVKGIEGYIAGELAARGETKGREQVFRIAAVVAGALVMVFGYFVAEAFILSLFDSTFGLTFAIAELPFNFVQGGISALVAYILSSILIKADVRGYLQ